MIQILIVAFIVAAAAGYAAWVLMPAAWRRAGAARLARRLGLAPARAQQLQARLEGASACGECASCKGCGGAPRQPR